MLYTLLVLFFLALCASQFLPISALRHQRQQQQHGQQDLWSSICYSSSGEPTLTAGLSKNCAAFGFYNDTIATDGWSYLHVESNGAVSDSIQSFAAGYLEGYITAGRIYESKLLQFWHVFGAENPTFDPQLVEYINENEKFNRFMAETQANDPLWRQVGLIWTQLDGLYAGYSQAVADGAKSAAGTLAQPLTRFDLLILNIDDEVGDVQATIDAGKKYGKAGKAGKKMAASKPLRELQVDRCSSIVKLTDQDLFIGHTTW
jgi:hypothetical protein